MVCEGVTIDGDVSLAVLDDSIVGRIGCSWVVVETVSTDTLICVVDGDSSVGVL